MARAELFLNLKSGRLTESIAKSLEPELCDQARSKAHARMKIRRNSLELRFQAEDTVALRAIMNSYLRMIKASINVAETVLQLDKPRR